jgi:molybdate transport system regulatory protein
MAKPSIETAPQLRLRVVQNRGIIIGPGRADLLELIQTQGSIAAAGRQMRMSYKRAWALVDAMNTTFAAPLVEAAKGGAGGGGARLTPLGSKSSPPIARCRIVVRPPPRVRWRNCSLRCRFHPI